MSDHHTDVAPWLPQLRIPDYDLTFDRLDSDARVVEVVESVWTPTGPKRFNQHSVWFEFGAST